ncbi:hypothetical protein DND132_2462 [Pseudodesulfovibrio mercurii]|uniref:Uncharacterized protein n=1 Tax=Pseudodesulfovibrio mercurii TaxID=641491 RepID=F0JCI5_9BACT|nr:hypothetical protein [Pseudodesulfovibrio mercurii]EGB15665.1 hypothetical protein DND132_2462 [Pseudodesulfovibrio mercurii]
MKTTILTLLITCFMSVLPAFGQGYSDEALNRMSMDEKMSSIGFELYENAKSTVRFSNMDQMRLCVVATSAKEFVRLMDTLHMLRTIFRNTTPKDPAFLKEWRVMFMDLKLGGESLKDVIAQVTAETPIDPYTLAMLNQGADDFGLLIDEVVLELLGPADE